MSFEARLYRLLWEPSEWLDHQQLKGLMTDRARLLWEQKGLQLSNGYLRFLMQKTTGSLSPEQFSNTATRLCLLTKEEQERLAFGVAVLPLAGQLSKHLDGHLRRSLSKHCQASEIIQLDALKDETSVISALPAHAWRDEPQVIERALMSLEQLQTEPHATLWRWHRAPLTAPSAVVYLTLEDVKKLCKILLPDLPWLVR